MADFTVNKCIQKGNLTMEEVKYNVTNHAMERYAERVAGKTEIANMRMYISEHKEDINERIHKLINYGTLIYEGKVKEYPVSRVYYKDYWVVIVDPKTRNVVTLYKVDLGDDEVNELFVGKTLAKLGIEKIVAKELTDKTEKQKKEYQSIIDGNNSEIAYYKKLIKSMEEVNESYKTLIKNVNLDVDVQEIKIRNLVETLISGRKF